MISQLTLWLLRSLHFNLNLTSPTAASQYCAGPAVTKFFGFLSDIMTNETTPGERPEMDTGRWPHNLHPTIPLRFHLRMDIHTFQDLAETTSSHAALPQYCAECRCRRVPTRLQNSRIGRCRSGGLLSTITFTQSTPRSNSRQYCAVRVHFTPSRGVIYDLTSLTTHNTTRIILEIRWRSSASSWTLLTRIFDFKFGFDFWFIHGSSRASWLLATNSMRLRLMHGRRRWHCSCG